MYNNFGGQVSIDNSPPLRSMRIQRALIWTDLSIYIN